jgi:hypothetical protein
MGSTNSKSNDPRVAKLKLNLKVAKALKSGTREQELRKQAKILNLQSQLLSISDAKIASSINRVAGSSTAMSAKNEKAVEELLNRARAAAHIKLKYSMPTAPKSGTRRKNRKSKKTRRTTRRN